MRKKKRKIKPKTQRSISQETLKPTKYNVENVETKSPLLQGHSKLLTAKPNMAKPKIPCKMGGKTLSETVKGTPAKAKT
jgi:hypothetical protein